MKYKNYVRIIALTLTFLIISLPIVLAEEFNRVYDANGNLISDGKYYREYNGLNQLVRVRLGNTSTSPVLEEYRWHPIEEKIVTKRIFNNGVYNYTIHYPNENIVVIVNSSGTFYEKYIYQEGTLVAQVNTDGQKQAIHSDHEGTNTLITDFAGNIIENNFYSPYGEFISGGKNSRYGYEGKEYDSLTDRFDFGFRQIDLSIPIWDKADTQIYPYDPQSLNRYMFERGNPYGNVDPDGHSHSIKSKISGTIRAVKKVVEVIKAAANTIKKVVDSVKQGVEKVKEYSGYNAAKQGVQQNIDFNRNLAQYITGGGQTSGISNQQLGKSAGTALIGTINIGLFAANFETGGEAGVVRAEGKQALNIVKTAVSSDIKINKGQATITYKNLFPKGVKGDYHETIIPSYDRYGNVYKANIHGTIQRGGDLKNIKTHSSDLATDETYEVFLNSEGK